MSLSNNSDKKEVNRKYIKRLLIPFFVWLIIDLPFKFYDFYKIWPLHKCIKELIKWALFYPWGALWYVSSLIVAIIIINYLRKKININKILVVSIPLYVFALLCNNYYFLVKDTMFGKVILKYKDLFISERNGLFVGLIFVSLGIIIYRLYNEKKINYKKTFILMMFSYILLIVEIFLIKNKAYLDDGSLYVMILFFIPSLIAFLTKYRTNKETLFLRHFSTGLYFIHFSIIEIVKLFFSILYINVSIWINLCVVLLMSSIIIVILHKVNNRVINKIIF